MTLEGQARARHRNKRQPNFKRRSKAIPIHIGYDLIYTENPKEYTPTPEKNTKNPNMLIKKFSKKQNNLKSSWELRERG